MKTDPFCEPLLLLGLDAGHTNPGEGIAMADAPAIFAAPLELEDAQLGTAQVLDDLDREARTLEIGRPDGDGVPVADHEDLLEADLLAGVAGHARQVERLVRAHLGLVTVDFDDRVHGSSR